MARPQSMSRQVAPSIAKTLRDQLGDGLRMPQNKLCATPDAAAIPLSRRYQLVARGFEFKRFRGRSAQSGGLVFRGHCDSGADSTGATEVPSVHIAQGRTVTTETLRCSTRVVRIVFVIRLRRGWVCRVGHASANAARTDEVLSIDTAQIHSIAAEGLRGPASVVRVIVVPNRQRRSR